MKSKERMEESTLKIDVYKRQQQDYDRQMQKLDEDMAKRKYADFIENTD